MFSTRVPAGLPLPAESISDPRSAEETVRSVLAAAAAARGRMTWTIAESHAREAADLASRQKLPDLWAAAVNELAAVRLSQGLTTGIPDDLPGARGAINRAVAAMQDDRAGDALGHLGVAEGQATDGWEHQLVRLNRAAILLESGELDRKSVV